MRATTRADRNTGRIVLATVASLLIAMVILMAGAKPSLAQRDPYGHGSPTTKPTRIIADSDPGDPPLAMLPFTGGDVTIFLVLGMSAIGVGTFMVRRHENKKDSR